jgi:hypothetical protein
MMWVTYDYPFGLCNFSSLTTMMTLAANSLVTFTKQLSSSCTAHGHNQVHCTQGAKSTQSNKSYYNIRCTNSTIIINVQIIKSILRL